ncbi:hypothetical protein [Natronococcus occultus]|uniref:DUF7973 domain-containing protein n=1 Tax=Natronococcus occultus SP4 TaxID=694430 RepID=L0K0N7_9EURY|nr:hypothetical protein Natoc_1896 [Natronococcus occultus SP4]
MSVETLGADVVVLQVLGWPIELLLAMLVAAFAGGVLGAALGALPAFVFTGFMVIAGEMARIAGMVSLEDGFGLGDPAGGVTAEIAFGAFFGPHIAFAAGAAATAYAAKQGYMEPGFGGNWGYHDGKNILIAFAGKHDDVLLVGGAFGVLGFLVFFVSDGLGLPWDPIAMGVVISALAHRLALGYGAIGDVRADGLLDVSPFEREDDHATAGEAGEPDPRLDVEPWLPWYYQWSGVTIIGFAFGVLGGLTFWATGSPYLAFGISAASLIFLNLGITDDFATFQVPVPVTHHITLPAATAPMAYAGLTLADATPSAAQAELLLAEAIVLGAIFGVLGALFGELSQRIFYMHGDTHWDPPATSIVATTFVIAVLALVGVFPTSGWVPLPI